MKPMLHHTDEELDLQSFRAYIKSLPDDDLIDIRRHLDGEQFPARADAIRRELLRRPSRTRSTLSEP
jgi:hypothetical protein